MSAPLASLPRPLAFSLYGGAAALLVALSIGELTWWLVRPESPADQPPVEPYTTPVKPARFAVNLTPAVSVYPGGKNAFGVRVAGESIDGPVAVRFASEARGVTAHEVTISAGETGARAELVAASGAKPGVYSLTATAGATVEGKPLTARARAEVTVLALPPPGPRLAVTVSPRVEVYPRGGNHFAVRVARGEFGGDVLVSFTGLPDGVTVPDLTVRAGETEATAELTAGRGAKPGGHQFQVTARGGPRLAAVGGASAVLDVRPTPTRPLDLVFALDCTPSMKMTAEAVRQSLPVLTGELAKAHFDLRLGLVGFQDTTLGQRLQILRVGGEKFAADRDRFAAEIRGLRFAGGGGEGDSSLDAVAEAADYPFREGALRVLVLVTDGAPKKVDGRVKSAADAAKQLRAREIDQLQLVALPQHRKAFDSLTTSAKGAYLDLKEVDDSDALLLRLAKAIIAAAPEPPVGKADPAPPAAQPSLPVGLAALPQLPEGAEPEEPKFESAVPAKPQAAEEDQPSASSEGRRVLATLVWAVVVVLLTLGAIFAGQETFLPAPRPSPGLTAACYGAALVLGLAAGAAGVVAFGALGMPLLARLGGATLFGLCAGLAIPVAERAFRAESVPLDLPLEEPPPEEAPLELGEKQAAPVVAAPSLAPRITAPKPAGGCPGCGRLIPGEAGSRYCMLCDQTF